MSVVVGSRLGPYDIVALVGSGGMGHVYRAFDTRLKRTVAIKVSNENFSERSAREARLVAALNHPNICHLYDFGPNYLVMELVEGPTLDDRLQKGPVPQEESLAIANQIADALAAAHEKGIVHRDLKPANIKLSDDGTVKVLDFGLAVLAEPAAATANPDDSPTLTFDALTAPGAVIGTAAYMAPEQARGKRVDKRTDIWAFGVILYEMLTGRRLFASETVADTLSAVLTREPDWSRVPPRFEKLLRHCLAKDPKNRLRDIGDARLLLDETAALQRPRQAHVGLWQAAAGILAIAALAAIVIALRTPRREAAGQVMRLNVDFGDDAALSARRGDSMALSPDGSRVVFVAGTWNVDAHLSVRRLDQSRSTPLSGTEGAESPFFSPDGRYIGFFADEKLKKVEAGGGTPITVCDAPANREGSWGDDDNIVFASRVTNVLARVPAAGGTPQQVTRLDPKRGEDAHRYPQVLPGAKAVLFMSALDFRGEGEVDVVTLATGERKTVIEDGAYGKYLPSGHIAYVHRGALYIVPFDLEHLTLSGNPVPVLDDVSFQRGTGTAAYTFSRSGIFLYTSVPPEARSRRLNFLGEHGESEPLPLPAAQYREVSVSPDGHLLAVTLQEGSENHIWLYEFASRRFWRFYARSSSEHPVWSPDGKYLVFVGDEASTGPGIYCMRSDGTGAVHRLVEGRSLLPSSISAQPSKLYYMVERGPRIGTWEEQLDWNSGSPKAGNAQQLPDDAPAVSPDQRWLAYVHVVAGTPAVFVRPVEGAGGPWQVGPVGDQPVWARTRRELFFLAVGQFQIMATDYTVAGDAFTAASPRLWNPTHVESYDLMPDAKRAIVVPAIERKEATHAVFLLNFLDDLHRRFPARK